MRILAAAAVLAAVAGAGVPGSLRAAGDEPPQAESGSYRFSGARPWRLVRATEAPGYRIALSAPDGKTLEARVFVDAAPLRDDAPFPPDPESLPADLRSLLDTPTKDREADALAFVLTRSARTVLEAVERVVAFTSRRIRYESPGAHAESASEALRRGRASCVGRSLLAADLLLRSGIPARQVTGVLASRSADELTPDSRSFFDEALGGVRHRWIEVYVPRLGWVPSDPGGLANTVTARHVALAEAPGLDFGVETLALSAPLKRPALDFPGPGLTLARPRLAPAPRPSAPAPITRPEGTEAGNVLR